MTIHLLVANDKAYFMFSPELKMKL